MPRPRVPTATSPQLADLRSIELRLEKALVDLRKFRNHLQNEQADKGILGSRGLTQFCIDLLKSDTKPAWGIQELLLAAEKAGYAIPTARTLTKRLGNWQYRHGGVRWREELGGWTWKEDGIDGRR